METINLSCPSCKAHLTVPSDKINNEKLLLICPKCNFRGNPISYIRLHSPQSSVPQKGESNIVDPTVIVGHNFKTALSIGQLTEVKSHTSFQLTRGQNWVGRTSTTSACEHQLAGDDTYVSRNHFEIEVVFNKVTLTYDHRLQDSGSKNGTKLNGQKLTKGDIILLKEGDRILAGKTELIFDFPPNLEDTAII